MPESVLTEPINVEKEVSKAAPGPPAKRSSKVFNSFQIAQAQFDKVAEYLGLVTEILCQICELRDAGSIGRVFVCFRAVDNSWKCRRVIVAVDVFAACNCRRSGETGVPHWC